MIKDLFGNEIDPNKPLRIPGMRMRGPKGGKRYTIRRGYAHAPGTGPAGKTCGDCEHHIVKRMGRDYHKCEEFKRQGGRWTGGPGSDILVRSPACKFFKEEKSDA